MRIIVGTMTGTSMDGVDAVAVSIEGSKEGMRASYIGMTSCELGDLTQVLRKLSNNGGTEVEMQNAALRLGEITTNAIQQLNLKQIDLIALHGQTIYHAPPISIQLIDPLPILETFNCTVLTDPRQSDLQLGGQGAPITPLADWILFNSKQKSTAIINLGGFCNITYLPANCSTNQVQGFDVCCCNLLLNKIARDRLGCDFDPNGECAIMGTALPKLVAELTNKLTEQKNASRSLGTGDDLGAFALSIGESIATNDLLASAVDAIGACISASTQNAERVYLAGGGVHNRALASAITHAGTTAELGVPIQAREGMAMAILGALSQDGVSITLPQITGREKTSSLVGWVQARP